MQSTCLTYAFVHVHEILYLRYRRAQEIFSGKTTSSGNEEVPKNFSVTLFLLLHCRITFLRDWLRPDPS